MARSCGKILVARQVSRSINRIRYTVEQVNAHIKTWKILKEDYRRPGWKMTSARVPGDEGLIKHHSSSLRGPRPRLNDTPPCQSPVKPPQPPSPTDFADPLPTPPRHISTNHHSHPPAIHLHHHPLNNLRGIGYLNDRPITDRLRK